MMTQLEEVMPKDETLGSSFQNCFINPYGVVLLPAFFLILIFILVKVELQKKGINFYFYKRFLKSVFSRELGRKKMMKTAVMQ